MTIVNLKSVASREALNEFFCRSFWREDSLVVGKEEKCFYTAAPCGEAQLLKSRAESRAVAAAAAATETAAAAATEAAAEAAVLE